MAYRNERGDERFLGGNTTETAAELFERGDFKRALVYALRVIKVYPLDPLPYVIAGDAMQRLGSRDMEEVVGIEGDFLKEASEDSVLVVLSFPGLHVVGHAQSRSDACGTVRTSDPNGSAPECVISRGNHR